MHDVVRKLVITERVVNRAIQIANRGGEGRTGAYVCIIDHRTGQMILHALIGHGTPEKIAKWRELSLEKATRLLNNLPLGHETSEESMDEARSMYPGAIMGNDYIFSLSGMKAMDDEATMFRTAIALGQRNRRQTLKRISSSRNPRLRPLLKACHWTE